MKELAGEAWETWEHYNSYEDWLICITTNGTVKKNGDAVMGAGIANEAKKKYPAFPSLLGSKLKNYGNDVHYLGDNIITFPVKHNWYETADIDLIIKSCKQLMNALDNLTVKRGYDVYAILPRPGCGNGKLDWETQVKPVISKILDDRIWVISYEQSGPQIDPSIDRR